MLPVETVLIKLVHQSIVGVKDMTYFMKHCGLVMNCSRS